MHFLLPECIFFDVNVFPSVLLSVILNICRNLVALQTEWDFLVPMQKKKVTMNYHQFMASLAFITLCQTSYITAHAPDDLLIQMGEGRMIYLFQQKIVSFMNISMTILSISYICAEKYTLLKYLHAWYRLILSRRGNFSAEDYFRSSEILPGELKFG